MDPPFVYDHYVTGKNFVGRKMECTVLSNLLESGSQVTMYEPPKSGKMSVIQQTLYNRRASGKQFMVVHVNMFNVRTIEDFLVKYGTAVIRPLYSTQQEARQGTHEEYDNNIVEYNKNLRALGEEYGCLGCSDCQYYREYRRCGRLQRHQG